MTVAANEAPAAEDLGLWITEHGKKVQRPVAFDYNRKAMKFLLEDMGMGTKPTCSREYATMLGYDDNKGLIIDWHGVTASVYGKGEARAYICWCGELRRYFAIPFLSEYRAYAMGLTSFYADSHCESVLYRDLVVKTNLTEENANSLALNALYGEQYK